MLIIGAGLAGLVAAHMLPRAEVVEAAAASAREAHRALLRFRTPRVGEVTGVPFKAVRVAKEIFYNNRRVAPSIAMANRYALKVTGTLMPRSIWNLDPVTRYVAPHDFAERLETNLGGRITYGEHFDFKADAGCAVISTVPLGLTLKALGYAHSVEFKRLPIAVRRFKLSGADVYQTIYYPTTHHSLYRASITGDVLICEFVGEPEGPWAPDIIASFGLAGSAFLEHEDLDASRQRYGKILPIDERTRRAMLLKLTTQHDIYSLGRFGTWRNILLDDVVKDVGIIESLIISGHYASGLKSAVTEKA